MTQHGHVLLSEAALNNWEKIELEIPIQTNGYIYIYTANESMADVNVHFDDVEVILIEGPAVNGADYYPFGLAMEGRSWSSEPYRFGYQGQFSEYDEETGWNAFTFRSWDPTIGRWMATDPAGQYWSPYLGMGNNPVMGIDPTGGDCPTCPKGAEYDAYRNNSALFAYDPSVGVYSDYSLTIRPSFWDNIGITDAIESGNIFEGIWNSPLARYVIPDVMTFELSEGATFIWPGKEVSSGIVILTRGDDIGIYRVNSGSDGRKGFMMKGEVVYGFLYKWGDPRNLKLTDIYGQYHSVNAGLGIEFGGQWSKNEYGELNIVGGSVGIGVTLGGDYGKGTTQKTWSEAMMKMTR